MCLVLLTYGQSFRLELRPFGLNCERFRAPCSVGSQAPTASSALAMKLGRRRFGQKLIPRPVAPISSEVFFCRRAPFWLV